MPLPLSTGTSRVQKKWLNSLWPADVIGCQIFWSTLVKVTACYLMATCHYIYPETSRLQKKWFNSLWPTHDIWCQRFQSTSVQVMASCLLATSHYLNQHWLVKWVPMALRWCGVTFDLGSYVCVPSRRQQTQEILKISVRKLFLKTTHLKSQPHFHKGQCKQNIVIVEHFPRNWSGLYRRMALVISQHWLRWWLTCTNDDHISWYYMASVRCVSCVVRHSGCDLTNLSFPST